MHQEHHNSIFDVPFVIISLYGNISIDLDIILFINLVYHNHMLNFCGYEMINNLVNNVSVK